MYCPCCGNFINEDSAYCPYCGAQLNAQPQYTQNPTYNYVSDNNRSSHNVNSLAIVGFILSFLLAFVGLICSTLGYNDAPRCGGRGKVLSVAGIIISTFSIIATLVFFILILLNCQLSIF